MKKIILGGIIAVLIAGLAVGFFLWTRHPQVIVLSDGTKVTFLGASYGRHHPAPRAKLAGGGIRRGNTSIDTTNDTLVVWMETQTKPNQWPNYQLLVYDTAHTACIGSWSQNSTELKPGVQLQGFKLDAYPRWDRKIALRLMSWGNNGQRLSKEEILIPNPGHRGPFAQWTPETIPDKQSDGDVDVTLTELTAGVLPPYVRSAGVSRDDPFNKCVRMAFDVQQNAHPATNWNPVQAEISDATGNQVTGWINANYQNGQRNGYLCQSGLWPDEPAWKVRLEFSRTSGFNDNELWQLPNVPVRPGTQQDAQNSWNNSWNNSSRTNQPFAETSLNGIHLKLFSAIRFTNPNQNGDQSVSFSLMADPDPESEGMRLTPIEVTDDQGRALQNTSSSWGGGNYQYQFSNARNAKSLNLTIALHKSRFVEFTVKPEKQ